MSPPHASGRGRHKGMTDALSIALSGLTAQKQRLAATASNIANVSTTGPVPGAAPPAAASTAVYLPLQTTFSSLPQGGVEAFVRPDPNGYSVYHDPSSAHADAAGMVAAPDIDLAREAVTMLETKAAFKANLGVVKTQDEMMRDLLDVLA